MDLRLLEYFLETARAQSINRAAEVIHISQPTLSRQLAQLEDTLGVKLFIRGNKGIRLTSEGVLLRRRAQEILDLVGRTEDELRSQDLELEGEVVIGCGELASFEWLARQMGAFRALHPGVHFRILTANADESQDGMDRGLIDIGLLMEPINTSKYAYIRLPEPEHWAVILRPDDELAEKETVTAQDLAGRTLIFPRRPNLQGELAHWFGEIYDQLDIAYTSSLTTNSTVLIREGLGVSIAIEGSLSYRDPELLTSRRLSPALTSSCVVCWKRDVPAAAAVEAFIRFLQEQQAQERAGAETSLIG